MQALIAFWKAKLEWNWWLMSKEDRTMIQQTINALRELKKLLATSQVEREAEIVRTVKQLETIKVDITCKEHGQLHIISEPLEILVTINEMQCPFPSSFEYATPDKVLQRHPIDAIVAAEFRGEEDERARVLGIIEREYPACTGWVFWNDLKKGILK